MEESEGQQSASIQYCTSIRPDIGEEGRKRGKEKKKPEKEGKREGL